ncbi:histone acetyltransferase p300-like [Cydia strobilella]|uniref:histone acetyltransferase p300-like n=1 Tax=Cydia strobilella TaxID=1100964 RepID=UPI003004C5AF
MDAAQENADIRPANVEENELAMRERAERVQHAISCWDAGCSQPFCLKITVLKNHFAICQQRTNCRQCKLLYKFFGYHTERCTDDKCQVRFCLCIKKKLALKQTLAYKRHPAVDLLLKTISTDRLNYFGGAQDRSEYAVKVENYIYERAFTQSEYYRLLAVKMWEIEMDIDEREDERFGYYWDHRDVESKACQTDDVLIIAPEDN